MKKGGRICVAQSSSSDDSQRHGKCNAAQCSCTTIHVCSSRNNKKGVGADRFESDRLLAICTKQTKTLLKLFNFVLRHRVGCRDRCVVPLDNDQAKLSARRASAFGNCQKVFMLLRKFTFFIIFTFVCRFVNLHESLRWTKVQQTVFLLR